MWEALSSIANAVVAVVQAITGTSKDKEPDTLPSGAVGKSMRHQQAAGAAARDAGLRAQGGGK